MPIKEFKKLEIRSRLIVSFSHEESAGCKNCTFQISASFLAEINEGVTIARARMNGLVQYLSSALIKQPLRSSSLVGLNFDDASYFFLIRPDMFLRSVRLEH